MSILAKPIVSAFKSFTMTAQRSFDHAYSRFMGVPTLRYSEITPQLYLGGQYSRRGFEILKKRGITGIVSMRIRARKDLPNLGEVRFLHLPTIDWHAPSMTHLKEGARFITKEINQGGKVYVHCAAGEGRGPTMVAAYLVSTGLTVEDSLKQIRAVRKFIRPNKGQLNRLSEFAKQYETTVGNTSASQIT